MNKELLQQALEALNHIYASTPPYREDGDCTFLDKTVEMSNAAIAALEVAIAPPVQPAPVAQTEQLERLANQNYALRIGNARLVARVRSLEQSIQPPLTQE